MRLLISGGPGAGCTSTAKVVGERLGLPVFHSDAYFHRPTDPPFQEQFTPDERRFILGSDLSAQPNWILSGSVATWGIDPLEATHGVFLNASKATRLQRLLKRQRTQFGSRIDPGGDLHDEHESFMVWAAGYEDGTGPGRNSQTDRGFLINRCEHFLEVTADESLEEVVSRVITWLEI
jgi:adenylate kinase family enzyme